MKGVNRRHRRQGGGKHKQGEGRKDNAGTIPKPHYDQCPKQEHDAVINCEPPRNSGAVPGRLQWND
eukprot:11643014-Karenia_brevis.AAC.1